MSEGIGDLRFLKDTSDRVREIFQYWDTRRGERAMPQRRDFDPIDLPKHLPGIILIDVEGIDEDGIGIYRYRVVGTAEVSNRGYDPTGKLVTEGYFGPSLPEVVDDYETVRQTRSFLYEPIEFIADDYKVIDELSIVLPFSEDGETVSQILVFSERRLRG